MSKRRINLASAIKCTIGALIILTAFLVYRYLDEVDIGNRVVSVIIKPGDSFSSVADRLLDEQVVSSRIMLCGPARLRGIDKSLIPGRYDFTGKNSCRSVLDRLQRGDFLRIKVTIYEGAPIWKVASILAHSGLEIDSATVAALNRDSAFLLQLGLPSLEGYLFPETYFFPWGTGVKEVIKEMVGVFRKKTDSIWPESNPGELTGEEVVVLASIIEAEAKLDEEKPVIASVYLNRLARGWKLDADPTVIYGLGGLDRPLMKRDLRRETPYNTYRHKGLPPTPINSPGLPAIMAALNPDTTDFLYFVADGTGGHRFSRTNAEHNRARYEIKRELRENGR
jgi:UPF0755 protein